MTNLEAMQVKPLKFRGTPVLRLKTFTVGEHEDDNCLS